MEQVTYSLYVWPYFQTEARFLKDGLSREQVESVMKKQKDNPHGVLFADSSDGQRFLCDDHGELEEVASTPAP